ncbi:hypothetical protein Pla100_28880 [Neorhodopirellula pilleata]|uniref:Uncharacterized protein n=1 Tax=Neorhodopirellula pilleata TaxID=2714738 RepID=A0A5C6AAR6_9BACT|nr:hypothetical protein Pla100_28880 [Neorhodopirellula pilleata]
MNRERKRTPSVTSASVHTQAARANASIRPSAMCRLELQDYGA